MSACGVRVDGHAPARSSMAARRSVSFLWCSSRSSAFFTSWGRGEGEGEDEGDKEEEKTGFRIPITKKEALNIFVDLIGVCENSEKNAHKKKENGESASLESMPGTRHPGKGREFIDMRKYYQTELAFWCPPFFVRDISWTQHIDLHNREKQSGQSGEKYVSLDDATFLYRMPVITLNNRKS